MGQWGNEPMEFPQFLNGSMQFSEFRELHCLIEASGNSIAPLPHCLIASSNNASVSLLNNTHNP